MRWSRVYENKSSIPNHILVLVFVLTVTFGIASIPNVESFSPTSGVRLQPPSRSKTTPRIAMPLVSTSRRRRASHRSAALNPSSDQGSWNQTTSSSSVHQQEATSQTEVALNPLHSTNNDLPLPPPIQQKSGDSSITIETIAIMATASTAFFVALVGLLSASGPGSWRFYVAGGTCAAISHAIATPIDVVKVRTTFSNHDEFP